MNWSDAGGSLFKTLMMMTYEAADTWYFLGCINPEPTVIIMGDSLVFVIMLVIPSHRKSKIVLIKSTRTWIFKWLPSWFFI